MVRWHPPRSVGAGAEKGIFKTAESWFRWFRKHGHNAPASHGLPHRGGIPQKPLGIKRLKQREHIPGTPEYRNRRAQLLAQKKAPQSAWSVPESEANRLTYEAWNKGKPVPGQPNKRQLETGTVVGHTGRGQPQTAVRVHIDQDAQIHGHPASYR